MVYCFFSLQYGFLHIAKIINSWSSFLWEKNFIFSQYEYYLVVLFIDTHLLSVMTGFSKFLIANACVVSSTEETHCVWKKKYTISKVFVAYSDKCVIAASNLIYFLKICSHSMFLFHLDSQWFLVGFLCRYLLFVQVILNFLFQSCIPLIF